MKQYKINELHKKSDIKYSISSADSKECFLVKGMVPTEGGLVKYQIVDSLDEKIITEIELSVFGLKGTPSIFKIKGRSTEWTIKTGGLTPPALTGSDKNTYKIEYSVEKKAEGMLSGARRISIIKDLKEIIRVPEVNKSVFEIYENSDMDFGLAIGLIFCGLRDYFK